MGLPDRDALALLGFYPFASGWADAVGAEAGVDPPRFGNGFYRWRFLNSFLEVITIDHRMVCINQSPQGGTS